MHINFFEMKLLNIIYKYLKYWFTAQRIHSIQSPFLYELATQVIRKKTANKSIEEIQHLRNRLSQSEQVINITDFGAGSNINPSTKRKIKDIAKNSSKNSKFGILLYNIISFYKPKNIIELGTSLAISTLYLSKACNSSKVYSFEGCPETIKIAEHNIKEQKVKNVSLVLGDFDTTLNNKLNEIGVVDLVFFDGNHTEKATIKYFEECLKYSHNNTIFIFDDIHWSKEMENAWDYVKQHKKTTLTVNLFFIGIVFIKNELSKENFTLKF